MKPLIRSRLLTVLTGALALATGSLAQGPEATIKIAIVSPITGPVAQYGGMQMLGVHLARGRHQDAVQ